MCKSAATRITLGSITAAERSVEKGTANVPVPPGDTYFYDEEARESGNALGLPNMGMFKYAQVLERMVRMVREAGKEFCVSVNGATAEEILKLASFSFAHAADRVEINLACPNVHDRGSRKSLMCQDPGLVEEILEKIDKLYSADRSVGIKIAPTRDEQLLEDIASIVNMRKSVREVVATNTRGGQRFIRHGADMIAFRPPGSDAVVNVGGQAGTPLHEDAVWVAEAMRHFLDDDVRVIGVGGIFDGKTAFDFVRKGIGGVQCATAYLQYREGIFGYIANSLLDYMSEDA
jgi:dihydroorotate dehydrogenase (fumarate)